MVAQRGPMLVSWAIGTYRGVSNPFMMMAQDTALAPLLWGKQGDRSAAFWPPRDRGLASSCVPGTCGVLCLRPREGDLNIKMILFLSLRVKVLFLRALDSLGCSYMCPCSAVSLLSPGEGDITPGLAHPPRSCQ